MKQTLALCLLAIIASISAVDKNNFKTCDQASFCRWVIQKIQDPAEYKIFFYLIFRRSRKIQYEKSPYEVVPNTLSSQNTYITADIINKENNHLFVLKLEGVKVRMNVKKTSRKIKLIKIKIFRATLSILKLTRKLHLSHVIVSAMPFKRSQPMSL
jgi:hypothetical protein